MSTNLSVWFVYLSPCPQSLHFFKTLHATFISPQVIGKMKKILIGEFTFPTSLVKTKLCISLTTMLAAAKHIVPHIYLRKIIQFLIFDMSKTQYFHNHPCRFSLGFILTSYQPHRKCIDPSLCIPGTVWRSEPLYCLVIFF